MDNGSLSASSILGLRRIAAAVSSRIGSRIDPISLLHSSAVSAAELAETPAEILEPAIRRRYEEGIRAINIVPLFFGPSAAITEYIPARIERLQRDLPGLRVRLAPHVVASEKDECLIAHALASRVRSALRAAALNRPAVVVVDHGSPCREVTAVRDRVAGTLAHELGSAVSTVIAASMERRSGEEYAFNEPLLERALAQSPCADPDTRVVVSLMFFSPGRHAGPDGDVARICEQAAARSRGVRTFLTEVVGDHESLIEILVGRVRGLAGSG